MMIFVFLLSQQVPSRNRFKMQTYEILVSLVLPSLVFGQKCPTKTHDHSSLDVKGTENAGTLVELILQMKLKYSRDCNMACCVYSTSGNRTAHLRFRIRKGTL